MSEKFWRPFGHFADVLSVGQALLGLAAFSAVAAFMTWAASTVEPIWRLGWGAVVISGVLLASVAGLVISAGLVAWRYFWPLPSSPPKREEGHEAQPTLERRLYFSEEEWNEPLRQIFRRRFFNETVEIEGCEFIECHFEQVTLHYNGNRGFRMTKCTMSQGPDGYKCNFSTENPVIKNVLFAFAEISSSMRILDMDASGH